MSYNIIQIQKQVIGNEEVNSVNARDLQKKLGNKKDFTSWIKQQIKSLYLEKNQDYVLLTLKGESKIRGGDRRSKNYILTLDAAKHIAMASRTPKGKEVRAYFIEVEKAYKNGISSVNNEKLIKDVASVVASVVVQSIEPLVKLVAKNNEMLSKFLNNNIANTIETEPPIEAIEARRAPEHMHPAIAKKLRARKWTKDEVELMLKLTEEGYSSAEIGYKLYRSAASVRVKRFRVLGLWIEN